MDDDPPIVLGTALKHGVDANDAQHAWAFAIDLFILSEGMLMFIGPDRAGNLLEVGVVEWHGGPAIVHAMAVRPKFQR